MWRQRLLSPHLIISEHTDYLIDQFDSLQANCSVSMPYTTSAATLYPTQPATTTTATIISTSSTMPGPAATTCAGQIIPVPPPNAAGCNSLSDKYGVATGAIRDATQDFFCTIQEPVCVPLVCDIEVIWGGKW